MTHIYGVINFVNVFVKDKNVHSVKYGIISSVNVFVDHFNIVLNFTYGLIKNVNV